jgi:hypothetical protein
MAANNKRIPIKHIRDGAKARYPEKEFCAICDTEDNLELHHFTGLTNLLEKWQKETGVPLDTDEQVLAIRDRFIAEHEYELYEAVVVLCEEHHRKLHLVYGKSPALTTAKKQEQWVLRQKDKYNGIKTTEPSELVSPEAKPSPRHDVPFGGGFGRFIHNQHSFSSLRTP